MLRFKLCDQWSKCQGELAFEMRISHCKQAVQRDGNGKGSAPVYWLWQTNHDARWILEKNWITS